MKKSQIRILDRLWANAVKKRDGYKCRYCLEDKKWLNACHIVGRRYRSLRWELSNGVTLCYPCHQIYDEHGLQHEKIIDLAIGRKRYNRLYKTKEVIAKNQDFEEIKKSLE